MKVYKSEIKDGLGEVIQSNSIAFCSEATPYSPTEFDMSSFKAVAENKNQLDSTYTS